jgi:glutamate synthase domain-containing protein 3
MDHWKNHHGSLKNFALKMRSPGYWMGAMMERGITADLKGSVND